MNLNKSTDTGKKYTTAEILRAWSPFIIMTVVIIVWGLQPVKDTLNSIGQLKFYVPGLQNAILSSDGTPLIIKPVDINYLSNSGTAMLFAAILSLPLIGMSFKEGAKDLFFYSIPVKIYNYYNNFNCGICFYCKLFRHVDYYGNCPGKYRISFSRSFHQYWVG